MKSKHSFEPAVAETVIGHGLHVKGELKSQNDLWLDGAVEGNISAEGNVTIGVNGQVNGHVTAAIITVGGQVKGNLTARDNIVLDQSANITGDIKCETLGVADGAILNGSVSTARHEPDDSQAEETNK